LIFEKNERIGNEIYIYICIDIYIFITQERKEKEYNIKERQTQGIVKQR